MKRHRHHSRSKNCSFETLITLPRGALNLLFVPPRMFWALELEELQLQRSSTTTWPRSTFQEKRKFCSSGLWHTERVYASHFPFLALFWLRNRRGGVEGGRETGRGRERDREGEGEKCDRWGIRFGPGAWSDPLLSNVQWFLSSYLAQTPQFPFL